MTLRTLIIGGLLLLLVAEVYLARAIDVAPAATLMEDAQRMLDGMPVLISIGEAARTVDGQAVVVYTRVGERTKIVAPMPASGVYPASVFRYRVRANGAWQWVQEIVYSDESVRRMEVSR